jgi:1-acyl-sn-glycerol-3-phosphate acyltransferase
VRIVKTEAANHPEPSEISRWDPEFVKSINGKVAAGIRKYFRSEVRSLGNLPQSGGALVVSNHSGGMFTPDILLFAPAVYDAYGFDRPVFTLAHDTVFIGPLTDWLPRAGVIHATRENADDALRGGGLVLVFPGGDWDSYRPTSASAVVDFNGRTGYVRTAIEAGVPIVPMVSIGGQETQLFLTRGNWLAEKLGLGRLLRMQILPLSIGFPFGLSLFFPPNFPLPAKIVTRVCEPIDPIAEFGPHPDRDAVDARVREVMQAALDELARERRFPLLG